MVRTCGACAQWDHITDNGKGRQTGYCSHPLIGRVTNASDHCPFYVRGNTRGPVFDVGSAVDAFEDMQKGLLREKVRGRSVLGPPPVPLDVLRARRP